MRFAVNMYSFEQLIKANSQLSLCNLPFVLKDVTGAMKDLEMTDLITVNITHHDGVNDPDWNIKNFISDFLQRNKKSDIDKYVIITSAYISTTEFPESEYYLEDNEAEIGKKQIPFDDVLDRDSNYLESIGFLNINDFVRYKYSRAFIFGNAPGKKIKKYFDQKMKE